MVALPALWLPILLAAFLVFAASAVIHMFLPYHRNDYGPVPREDEMMGALRRFEIPPGDRAIPYSGGDPEVLKSEAFREKVRKGPVVFMTVLPKGDPFAMGAQLTQWFLYCLVVSLLTAYLAKLALDPGADYMVVFRFVGTAAFIGYGLALPQKSIWYRASWSTMWKSMLDAFVYGLVTAGAFAWLWP